MMSLVRLRPVVTRAVRLATPIRSFTSSRPYLVSGYGSNSSKGGHPPIDQQASGEIPIYSGPSIAEKRKGGPVNVDEEMGQDIKSKRDADFADNMFEEPKGLANDGSDWNGEIRAPRSDLQNAKASKGKLSGNSDAAGKLKKKGTKLTGDAVDIGQPKRHWTNFAGDEDPSLKEDWKDDAQRMKEKAKNQLHKAKLSVEDTAVDLKEGAQEVWHKTKKAARSAKESIKDSVDSITEKSSAAADDLYGSPVNTFGKGQPGHRLFNSVDEESTAVKSGEVIGEDVDSLRKSFWDGPQDMPQGVGKRAVDEKGRPLETGTRDS